MNSGVNQPVQLYENNLADVGEFIYIGSIMSSDLISDAEVKARLAKARAAFRTLMFWRNGNISQNTQLRICNTNVLSLLFYGS